MDNTVLGINTIVVIYCIVTFILLIRFVKNLTKLYSFKLEKGNPINKMNVFYHCKRSGVYSFFNRLYLPNEDVIKSLPKSILKHEIAHFKQFHSLDIILIEIAIILFWFNPAFWFYKKSIKQNHEFLADHSALISECQNTYLHTILKQLEVKNYSSLGSNFSYLSIKKRIQMIKNRNKKLKNTAFKTIALCICTSFLGLFSFKTIEIDRNINSKLINTVNIDLLDRPTGLPIQLDKITKVSGEYGNRIHPITKKEKIHTGIDLIADEGTEIIAAGKRKVVKVESIRQAMANIL